MTDKIVSMIDERRYTELREQADGMNPADLAEIFEELPIGYYAKLYRILPKELAAETFSLMEPELQKELIDSFTDKELSDVLSEMYVDDTVDMIEEMPAVVVKRILRASTAETRNEINELLRYPKNSAGTIMTTEYVRFRKNMTVAQALEHIRKVAIDKETVYTCYVTDEDRHLIGLVTAKKLLISPLDSPLEDIMEDNVISVLTTADREEVAQMFDKYGFIAIPVVDNETRLVGIVTFDDAIDVMQEETEEDFAKMAAVTPTGEPYIKTSAVRLWKARIPWLLILMISATFTGAIISSFEAKLAACVCLTAFIPMLMDTGGNAGSQSSVTIIRGLSLGEITFKDVFRVLFKEFSVSLMCGAVLSVVAFGKIILIDRMAFGNTAITPWIALVVSLTLFITVICSKLIGGALPILAKRMGFDPAVTASPIITTIVDAISLLVYFSVSTLILNI